tara:strand:- start:181 stop:360 length:180 start_codon:yes stop_codon:yes gene_type:complete
MKSIIKSIDLFSYLKNYSGDTTDGNNFPLQNYLAGSLGIISAVAPHLLCFKDNNIVLYI